MEAVYSRPSPNNSSDSSDLSDSSDVDFARSRFKRKIAFGDEEGRAGATRPMDTTAVGRKNGRLAIVEKERGRPGIKGNAFRNHTQHKTLAV